MVAESLPNAVARRCSWLLDIDGTLVHTDGLYRKVFQKLLTKLGYDVTDEWFAKNVQGKTDDDVFKPLLPAGTTEAELKAMSKQKDDCFVKLYQQQAAADGGPPLVRGLAEALEFAQQHGVRCIAVTNAQRGAGEACIASLKQHIPAAAIIEGLVIGAECTRAKPAPDPYVEGARQLGVQLADCLVFEDSRSGVRSGVAAEVCGVVGLRTSMTDAEMRSLGCVATLADWTELAMTLSADNGSGKENDAHAPSTDAA